MEKEDKKYNQIELRSDEVQEILTRPPHILVRSGIGVICGTLVIFFIATFFFKYPDVVSGTATITTENPPVWLVARTSGKIKELYCLDKQQISPKQLLAVIDNPANTSDVEKLKTALSECVVSDSVIDLSGFKIIGNQKLELGDMQSIFSNFLKAITNYNNYQNLNEINQEKISLLSQISGKRQYSASLKEQIGTKKRELELAQSAYNREKQLFEKGTLSKADLESAERNLLTVKQTLQQLESAIISDNIEVAQLSQTITKYDIQNMSDKNSLVSQLKTSYNELLTAIENWEQAYLLISPESGTVTFSNIWSKNQFVQSGEKVFAIVSQQSGETIGRIITPASGAGKIKTGQLVNFKLQNFPYMEYGILQGKVKSMSLIPNNNNYAIEVQLTNMLTTTSGKELPFGGELVGEGEVITDDLSLATRIISPLRTLFQKYSVE